jgi:hypothetical protein
MSQSDMNAANASGANFRADLNLILAAIVSNSSGATEPTTTFAYQFWADTTTALLKIRNAANSGWITIGRLDQANFGLNYFYSGNSAPSTTQAYMPWVDTNGAYPIYKIRNAANLAWITIGRLDVDNFGLMPLVGGTFSGFISFSNTDYIMLPKGTTAQRPGSPVSGMIRYNTDLSSFEGYNGTAWAPVGGGGYVVASAETISASGTITTSTTDVRQQRPVIGNAAAVDASTTPFGSGGGWKDGTEVLLIGTSDSDSVKITFNDAAKGCVGNFTELELTKYVSALFTYNATLDRWLYVGGK